MKSTESWKTISDGIRDLADCPNNYREYLNRKKADLSKYKSSVAPAKTLNENSSIRDLELCENLDKTYENLDPDVGETGLGVPAVVKRGVHTPIFESNMQRLRFFEKLHLSVPNDLIAFYPGDSHISIFVVVQVKEGRNISEILTEGGRIIQKLRPVLRECHTRAQKCDFKNRIKNIASIQRALLEMIYQELVLDSSTASHQDTVQRIRAMFLGAEELVADLQHLNTGSPGNKYDVFFSHVEVLIEESLVAADDRHHGASHLSQWVSIKDLIKETSAQCPENTPIPSKDLARLQFIPKYPYTRSVLNFTTRLQVKH